MRLIWLCTWRYPNLCSHFIGQEDATSAGQWLIKGVCQLFTDRRPKYRADPRSEPPSSSLVSNIEQTKAPLIPNVTFHGYIFSLTTLIQSLVALDRQQSWSCLIKTTRKLGQQTNIFSWSLNNVGSTNTYNTLSDQLLNLTPAYIRSLSLNALIWLWEMDVTDSAIKNQWKHVSKHLASPLTFHN